MRLPWSCIALLLISPACSSTEDTGPPPCGSEQSDLRTVIPGPGQAGYDAELAAAARRHDRLFVAVFSRATGMNADYSLSENTPEARAYFTKFVQDDDGWDFEAATGVSPQSLGVWHDSVGLYGGVGVAADAYRYGVLRDSGAACAEVEIARKQLVSALRGLDVAGRIAGVPGVNARGVLNLDYPNGGHGSLTPLFDAAGNPLPQDKDNGTWRADNSGELATWVWVDSLSRDMLVGWAAAYGAAWEVIKGDDSIDRELKTRLQENAGATARGLMKVGENGFDLEIPDADGRLTFHSYLNENAVDRIYVEGVDNGFNAVMALGIVAALAKVAEAPDVDAYLQDELIGRRRLPQIAASEIVGVNLGVGSNFSGFNMAFTAMWLAQRYIDDEAVKPALRIALENELWTKAGVNDERQPRDMAQSFFDVIYAAGKSGSAQGLPGTRELPTDALQRGLRTLKNYPAAPFFNREVINCDEDEIASGVCTLLDGTEVKVLGEVGWKGTLVGDKIVPIEVRPPSNYFWRSCPYKLNGGSDSGALMPAVDFRIAYWLGRWARVEAPAQ